MMPPLPDKTPPPTADEAENIAAQFLAQLQAGERPDREALMRAYPQLADGLNRRLALAEMVHRVGLAPGDRGTQIGETVDELTSISDPKANLPQTVAPGEGVWTARGLRRGRSDSLSAAGGGTCSFNRTISARCSAVKR